MINLDEVVESVLKDQNIDDRGEDNSLTDIPVLTPIGLCDEGEETPVLYSTPKQAIRTFGFRLELHLFHVSSVLWRRRPELFTVVVEGNNYYTVTCRVKRYYD